MRGKWGSVVKREIEGACAAGVCGYKGCMEGGCMEGGCMERGCVERRKRGKGQWDDPVGSSLS